MKALWTGTDSLMLVDVSKRKLKKKTYWLIFRFYVRLLDYFVQEHYADSDNIADNLREFDFKKPISIFKDKMLNLEIYKKVEHEEFNVLYYFPVTGSNDIEFIRWLYGIDIIEEAERRLTDCNFIKIDGTVNMRYIYPVTDFYLRPNRHDGSSRLVQECQLNEIPYYHSFKEPDIYQIIEKIKYEKLQKTMAVRPIEEINVGR